MVKDIAWIDGEWEVVEVETEFEPSLNETFTEPECNGQCLTGYDIGVPGGGIAYPHPQCPLHSWDDMLWPPRNEEDLAARMALR